MFPYFFAQFFISQVIIGKGFPTMSYPREFESVATYVSRIIKYLKGIEEADMEQIILKCNIESDAIRGVIDRLVKIGFIKCHITNGQELYSFNKESDEAEAYSHLMELHNQ